MSLFLLATPPIPVSVGCLGLSICMICGAFRRCYRASILACELCVSVARVKAVGDRGTLSALSSHSQKTLWFLLLIVAVEANSSGM
jgi:hypothetical protein